MIAQLSKNAKLLPAAAVLCLCLTTTRVAQADDAAVYAKTLQATGWIKGAGNGTCWVVDHEQRLVVTNWHVVEDKERAEVYFPMHKDGQLVTAAPEYVKQQDQLMIKGKILARDPKRDLAMVQLESMPRGVGVLALAENSAKNNDAVLSVGNSGLAVKEFKDATLWKMRTGKVVQKYFRVLFFNNPYQKMDSSFIDSTLWTSPGDSGGPVVNDKGELVGVTSNGSKTDCLAIDVSEVRAFLKSVKDSRRLPPAAGRVLTGAWTQTQINGNGQAPYCGITLRPDGTVLFEDAKGAQEGTFSVLNDRLTLVIPGLNLNITAEITWTGSDSFSITQNGVQSLMERR